MSPQPIPWDAKVIVTGDKATYRLLSTYDQKDFWEMFKVKAEFDSQIDLTAEAGRLLLLHLWRMRERGAAPRRPQRRGTA